MNTNRRTPVIMDFLILDSDKAVRFYAFCNGKSLSRLSRSGVCGTTRNPTTATPIYCIKAAIYLYSAIRPTKNRVALLPFSAFFLRQKFYRAEVQEPISEGTLSHERLVPLRLRFWALTRDR